MAEDTNYSASAGREEGAGRGSRQGGGREPGGFRIRLSDNEMRAARALQEAFGLRSTVAVLGFSLRTLAQQLEEGQLEELVAQHRSQLASRGPGAGARRGGERRRDRTDGRGGAPVRGQRVDPFARPSRPALSPEPEPESQEQLPSPASETEPSSEGVTLPAAGNEPQQDAAVEVEVPAPVDDRA